MEDRLLTRHGHAPGTPVEAALADDPELELVHADMDAWLDAHPCPGDCEKPGHDPAGGVDGCPQCGQNDDSTV